MLFHATATSATSPGPAITSTASRSGGPGPASIPARSVAVNAAVQADAEVSTNYGTADDMAAAARSVPKASGFYVSMTSPAIAEAGEFFDKMEAAGY